MLKTAFVSLFLFVLTSCGVFLPATDGGAPRVSTAEERAAVEPYILTAEDVLTTAFALKGITSTQFDLGTKLIAQFRQEVADSAKIPVDWPGVVRKGLRLAVTVLTRAKPPPAG